MSEVDRGESAILADLKQSVMWKEKDRNVSCEFFTTLNYHHVILILIPYTMIHRM